jgi:hypothetical protein
MKNSYTFDLCRCDPGRSQQIGQLAEKAWV